MTFASQAATLRENAKWLVTAFLSAGAILFSGLSFANLATGAKGGAWFPVALAAIPVFSAVVALWTTNTVLSAPTVEPAEVFPKFSSRMARTEANQSSSQEGMTKRIEESLPTNVAVYGSLPAFDDRLVSAYESVEEARRGNDGTPPRKKHLEAAYKGLDDLQDGVHEVLDCARYIHTQDRYRKALVRFIVAVIIGVTGSIAAGVSAGAASTQGPVAFDRATPVRVYFSGDVPDGADGPNHCRLWDGIYAWAVGGDFDRPVILFGGYDPDDPGRRRLGNTEITRCSTPWTWTGESGDVTLVPR